MVEGLLVARSWENKHLLPSRQTPCRKYLSARHKRREHQHTHTHLRSWKRWDSGAERSRVKNKEVCTCVSPAAPFSLVWKSWCYYQRAHESQRGFGACVATRWCSLYLQVTCFVDMMYPATSAMFFSEMLPSPRLCATWKYPRLHRDDADRCFRLATRRATRSRESVLSNGSFHRPRARTGENRREPWSETGTVFPAPDASCSPQSIFFFF